MELREARPSWITGDIFVAQLVYTTLYGWEPWDWAREILFLLQNSDIDDEHPEWRIHWIAGVSLLRTIGHVLHNVDAARSENHKIIISNLWAEFKADENQHWIFPEFIERERNNILKQFSFGASLPELEDERIIAFHGSTIDGVQLFREAVYWWRAQLLRVEKALLEGRLEKD